MQWFFFSAPNIIVEIGRLSINMTTEITTLTFMCLFGKYTWYFPTTLRKWVVLHVLCVSWEGQDHHRALWDHQWRLRGIDEAVTLIQNLVNFRPTMILLLRKCYCLLVLNIQMSYMWCVMPICNVSLWISMIIHECTASVFLLLRVFTQRFLRWNGKTESTMSTSRLLFFPLPLPTLSCCHCRRRWICWWCDRWVGDMNQTQKNKQQSQQCIGIGDSRFDLQTC